MKNKYKKKKNLERKKKKKERWSRKIYTEIGLNEQILKSEKKKERMNEGRKDRKKKGRKEGISWNLILI